MTKNQTPRYGGYDIDKAIRQARAAMQQTDPLTIATKRLAQDFAKNKIAQFAGRDLRLVAETLLHSAAALGSLVNDNMARAALNTQVLAAIYVLDDLEVTGQTPPMCDRHLEVQHRDGKAPWCSSCGWNRGRPAVPAQRLGEPRTAAIR